jgi:integrase/recombinase XerD
MTNLSVFQSVLSECIEGYIDEKKAVGYKFEKGASTLKRFDRFVNSTNLREISLPKELVESWTKRTPNESISNQCQRISILRGLAEYMNRLGYSAYIYPRGLVTVNRYSYIPYIFSEEEIRLIFNACDNYPQTKLSPNRHLILPLIIRMLYACGLRISEALKLTIDDINFKEGTLSITNTKFNKERIIPIPESLVQRCDKYRMIALADKESDYPFFPSPYGGHYSSSTVYWLFRKVLWQAGISHSGKGPRLHDLRHTFAVHCLKKWVIEGNDLGNCLPYLSVYLGHEDMRGTQRYLRLTADLYPDIKAKVEETCSWLIPEVELNETN